MANGFEIEIKSLLGSAENADVLRKKLLQKSDCVKTGGNSQLNHYFTGGDAQSLLNAVSDKFSGEHKERLASILGRAKNVSVRTREYNGKVLLVVKATVDDTTSSNGTAREEFEEEPSRFNLNERLNLTLDELDKLLLGAGFEYQAKWSRQREEYKSSDIAITIDKNAGYGYLAEFEKIVPEASLADETKMKLRAFMKELGAEELPQDRLERMFAHYNAHWAEYYGTDRVFTIL